MAVEYDLVVIGGTAAGLSAAIAAARLQARVALVVTDPLAAKTFWSTQTLMEVGRMAAQARSASQFGIDAEIATLVSGSSVRFDQAIKWAETVVATLAEQHSPAVLASLGIEVIFETGQFNHQPDLNFSLARRQLRSRAYLIATGTDSLQLDIEGLAAAGYLTCNHLLSQLRTTDQQWPQDIVVIGGGPTAIELSQTLMRLGCCVTIVTQSPHILALEDPEAASLIQAQLEAEGARILTHSKVTAVKQLEGQKKLVLAGEQQVEAKEILLAIDQSCDREFLNLEAVGVQFTQRGIWVNDKLQTSNPQIYACGDRLGGYPLSHVATYEAGIALKNALFWPIFKVDYRFIPWAIFTQPELARVGLTEIQARRRYGQQVYILRQFYKTVERAQIRGETSGFCKIIVQRNGRILGAHLVGPAAGEVIHLVAFAMKHRLKVSALADLVHISPTLSEINFKTASAWQNLKQYPGRQNFWENLFNLRRTWSS